MSQKGREKKGVLAQRKRGGPSKVESVTPVGQDAKPEIMKVTPVGMGHIEKKRSEMKQGEVSQKSLN